MEPEPRVDPLSTPVGHPNLEGHGAAPHLLGDEELIVEEALGYPMALEHRIHRDVRDVGLIAVADQAGIPRHVPIHLSDEVVPVVRLRHLRDEQVR